MREEKINFKDNMLYYFRIARPYWKLFLIIIFILFIVSLIEVGQNLILKVLIDEGTLFGAGSISKEAFTSTILFFGAVYFITLLILSVSKFFRVYLLNILEVDLMFDVKKDIFSHLLRLSHSFHSSNRTGSIISKIIRSGKGIEAFTDFLTFHGTPLILKILVSFFLIAFFDLLSAAVVLAVCLVFMFYSFIVLAKQQKVNLERNDAEDTEKGFISDVFMNIETVKHFGKERRIIDLFDNLANEVKVKFLEFWNYYAKMEAMLALIFGMGTIALMYFSLARLLEGQISVGSVAFIYTSYLGLILPLFEFMWGVRRTYEAMSDVQAIVEFKKINSEIKDKAFAKELKITKGSVEYKNVVFSYGRKEIINGFSLKIKPKEKIAFVGHSGAGKTTIVKLLYRLYDIKSGEILIDGKNIANVTQESLRSELSIVPQECILFNDTIYSNILFSNPEASKEKVFDALKAAQLYDFVMSLPQKENTIVGERGIKLSGGEKQRLSIARAILADKKILVLDEATSSLDSKTEYDIRLALEKLMRNRTTIIIAHRLSTIMDADKIIVMRKGAIEQVGTHEELSKKKGLYSSLWKLQKTGVIKK